MSIYAGIAYMASYKSIHAAKHSVQLNREALLKHWSRQASNGEPAAFWFPIQMILFRKSGRY